MCIRDSIHTGPHRCITGADRRRVLRRAGAAGRWISQLPEEDLRLLREGHSELVVGDFRPSLSISAPLAHIPYMNAVSYTHLDVYKRQTQSHGIARCPSVGRGFAFPC